MKLHEGERLRVDVLHAGMIRLDGGAMFGVVPRPLWEKRISPDDRNRIPLAMRCLLVRDGDTTLLVDTGLGNKESDKFRRIYGVQNSGNPTRLEDSLREVGVEPEDVDVVLNTHLHFDHAGGDTVRKPDGSTRPAFPRARYLVRRGEWEFAHRENERIRGSYLLHGLDPLEEAGVLELIEPREDGSATELLPAVRVVHTPGHTPHHQSVLLRDGGTTLCFLADLVPTTAHLPLPWIMGYDVEPLVTLEQKREILTRAGRRGWKLVFQHDPHVAAGDAVPGDGTDGCELRATVEDPVRGNGDA